MHFTAVVIIVVTVIPVTTPKAKKYLPLINQLVLHHLKSSIRQKCVGIGNWQGSVNLATAALLPMGTSNYKRKNMFPQSTRRVFANNTTSHFTVPTVWGANSCIQIEIFSPRLIIILCLLMWKESKWNQKLSRFWITLATPRCW